MSSCNSDFFGQGENKNYMIESQKIKIIRVSDEDYHVSRSVRDRPHDNEDYHVSRSVRDRPHDEEDYHVSRSVRDRF